MYASVNVGKDNVHFTKKRVCETGAHRNELKLLTQTKKKKKKKKKKKSSMSTVKSLERLRETRYVQHDADVPLR